MAKKYVDYSDETLVKYFKEIKTKTTIPYSKELELASRICEGDEVALNKLIEANLKFVISIAKEYQFQGVELSDLISDGNEGLIKAALRFDHTKGFKFISYAVWWVRQSIIQGLNNNSRLIRLPVNLINSLSVIKKKIEMFETEHNRVPINSEVDGVMLSQLSSISKPVSLNCIINADGDELIDLLGCEIMVDQNELIESDKQIRDELDNMLSCLSEREKDIIVLYFGLNNEDPITLEEIGKRYDITKERVRQVRDIGFRKLRHNSTNLFKLLKLNKNV